MRLTRRTGLVNVESGSSVAWTTWVHGHRIAFDRRADSHAVVTYLTTANSLSMQRVGYHARAVEKVSLINCSTGAVVYDPGTFTFVAVWGTTLRPWRAFAAHFAYPNAVDVPPRIPTKPAGLQAVRSLPPEPPRRTLP